MGFATTASRTFRPTVVRPTPIVRAPMATGTMRHLVSFASPWEPPRAAITKPVKAPSLKQARYVTQSSY